MRYFVDDDGEEKDGYDVEVFQASVAGPNGHDLTRSQKNARNSRILKNGEE